MKPYTSLIEAEAHILDVQFVQSKSLSHSGTKGSLREAYLRAFLRKLAPGGCEISGGFITDSIGSISPQLDLVAFDETLPAIQLDQAISIIPVESARLWMEVKSKLETKHLEPIKQRLASISSMQWSLLNNTSLIQFQPKAMPPGLLVCYESSVSQETVRKWVAENPFLYLVVVIGKYAMWNVSTDPLKTELLENAGRHEELLFLAAKLNQMVVINRRILDGLRDAYAEVPPEPTDEQIADFESKQGELKLDMVHFSLQTYFEL